MKKILTQIVMVIGIITLTTSAQAGLINGGDLLDQNGADQLELWLGLGDQDFTNIWDGVYGDSPTSWHTAVDGVLDTISIYDVTYDGQNYLLGGYRSTAWDSTPGYQQDAAAFIFNLTDSFMLNQDNSAWPNGSGGDLYATYNHNIYFATFGGGHDLSGGFGTLGNNAYIYGGYSYGHPAGTNLLGEIRSTLYINGLETYTFSDAATAPIPEPATMLLFGTGLVGLVGSRFRRKKK